MLWQPVDSHSDCLIELIKYGWKLDTIENTFIWSIRSTVFKDVSSLIRIRWVLEPGSLIQKVLDSLSFFRVYIDGYIHG